MYTRCFIECMLMLKKTYSSHFNKYRIEVSIKAPRCPVSKHPIASVLEHVPIQIASVAEAGLSLQEPSGLLPGVSIHVSLQLRVICEALHTLVTPVGLLLGVSPHVSLQVRALSVGLHTLPTPVGLLPPRSGSTCGSSGHRAY